MKITIERFVVGSTGGGSNRYKVVIDQPPHPAQAGMAHDEAWVASLAAAIAFINGKTEIAGPN